jgi:hypothetical protein
MRLERPFQFDRIIERVSELELVPPFKLFAQFLVFLHRLINSFGVSLRLDCVKRFHEALHRDLGGRLRLNLCEFVFN